MWREPIIELPQCLSWLALWRYHYRGPFIFEIPLIHKIVRAIWILRTISKIMTWENIYCCEKKWHLNTYLTYVILEYQCNLGFIPWAVLFFFPKLFQLPQYLVFCVLPFYSMNWSSVSNLIDLVLFSWLRVRVWVKISSSLESEALYSGPSCTCV